MYLHFGPVRETIARADIGTAGIISYWPPESSRADCPIIQKMRRMPRLDVSDAMGAAPHRLQKLHGIPFAMHQISMVAESVYERAAAGLDKLDAGELGQRVMSNGLSRERPWQSHPFGKMLMAYTAVQINNGVDSVHKLLDAQNVFNVTCGFGYGQSPVAFMALVAATAYLATDADYRANPGQLSKYITDRALENDGDDGFLILHADAHDNAGAVFGNESTIRGSALAMHSRIMPVILPKWLPWHNAMLEVNGYEPLQPGKDLKGEVLEKAGKVRLGDGHSGLTPVMVVPDKPEYERYENMAPCYRRTWTEFRNGELVEVWAPRLGD